MELPVYCLWILHKEKRVESKSQGRNVKNTCELMYVTKYSNVTLFLSAVLKYTANGITGTLQGNWSAGILNLWGLHVYPQSL